MYCPKCGNKLKDDDKFCTSCGFQMEEEEQEEKSPIGLIILLIIALAAIGFRYFYVQPPAET